MIIGGAITTFTHGYSWIVWRHQNKHLGLTPANGISPIFSNITYSLADRNNRQYIFYSSIYKWCNTFKASHHLYIS